MSWNWKRHRLAIGVAAGVLALTLGAAALLSTEADRWKPRAEAMASDALGMRVRIGGRLSAGFVPRPHVSAASVEILDERGAVVASARKVDVAIGWRALLQRQVRVSALALTQPRLSIEQGPDGRSNLARLHRSFALLGLLDGASVSLTDGSVCFASRRSGTVVEAAGLDVAARGVRFEGASGADFARQATLRANVACRFVRSGRLALSALELSVEGRNGVFEIRPIGVRLFGAQASGSLHADFTGAIPAWRVQCSLPRFRIEEFLQALSRDVGATGTMDFAADLQARGAGWAGVVASAGGVLSLRGENLVLLGEDLDRSFARFESSQNFSLLDVGALFLAGPLGVAATKGYDFASLFHGTGGRTTITRLVSEWRVERGVARARDVALATPKNRMALQGDLDFVHGRFAEVTLAVIDARGCAALRQVVRGPFDAPVVEKPRLLGSLAGPALRLVQRAGRLLRTPPCEPFYTGAVAAPG